ncbi:MAG: hypothetical protein ACRDRL_19350 [Sciscionella sp.]
MVGMEDRVVLPRRSSHRLAGNAANAATDTTTAITIATSANVPCLANAVAWSKDCQNT